MMNFYKILSHDGSNHYERLFTAYILDPMPKNLLPVSAFEDLSHPSYWDGGYYINYYNMPAGTYTLSTNMPEKDPADLYFNGENASCVPYSGNPVSIQVDAGGTFYILFFVNRGNYEKIIDGTYTVTLVRSDERSDENGA